MDLDLNLIIKPNNTKELFTMVPKEISLFDYKTMNIDGRLHTTRISLLYMYYQKKKQHRSCYILLYLYSDFM